LYDADYDSYDDEEEEDDDSYSLPDHHKTITSDLIQTTPAPQPGEFSVSPSPSKVSGESIKDDHGSAVPVDEAEETKRLLEMEERRAVEQQSASQRGIKSKTAKRFFYSKEKIPIVMALFLILCGIGVAIYFLLAASDSSSA
jgi:hypothetical protein